MYSTHFISEKLKLTNITSDNIIFCYLINLPYRLKIGKRLLLSMNDELNSKVIFENDILIPTTSEWEVINLGASDWKKFWTKAILIVRDPKIDKEELIETNEKDEIKISTPYFEIMQLLNQALLAYCTSTKEIFGGCSINLFSNIDFFDYLEWDVKYFINKNEITDDIILEQMLALNPERKVIIGQRYYGTLVDLESTKIEAIQTYVEKVKNDLFYEYAYSAISKMVNDDYSGALLMSVVALEGVHSAFLRKTLSKMLPIDEKEYSGVVSEFLREEGFTTLIKITPFIFLPSEYRPSLENIKDCLSAITMRNALMHVLTDNKGKYKIKKYSNSDISKAYSATFKVYECFLRAFEEE